MALQLAIGIYGVISYSVAQRAHEIGIRAALGATGGSLLRLILRGAMLLALSGIVLGLVGALALSRLLDSLLFRVGARPDHHDNRSRSPRVRGAARLLHPGPPRRPVGPSRRSPPGVSRSRPDVGQVAPQQPANRLAIGPCSDCQSLRSMA